LPSEVDGNAPALAIPLARWADRHLGHLARETGSAAIAALSGAMLLGERAALNGYPVPGVVSAGGGCRLIPSRNGWIALNLARPDDRELLPALFGDGGFDPFDDAAIAVRVARSDASALLTHGRTLGLAVAGMDERPQAPSCEILTYDEQRGLVGHSEPSPSPSILSLSKDCTSSLSWAPDPQEKATLRQAQDGRWVVRGHMPDKRPLVLDLSALWGGPLAGHLLWLVGAEVIKIENPRRPDALRHGDPALFARLNQGKASVTIDFATTHGRAVLLALIARADLVIEATRPRALAQLGIDADALVASHPGLVWLTITAHGARLPQAGWVGFGDDAAVAGGLTAALQRASGCIGFGGDAPADPLIGIAAALAGWRGLCSGTAQRIGLTMSAIVADALADERAMDAARLNAELRRWAGAQGTPFPAPSPRKVTAEVRALGADNDRWLPC
jgi:hypothetical protein